MCTVTAFQKNAEIEVFFNRDESRKRQKALPPSLFKLKNTKYIAPIDTDAKGTWILVNEFGIILCLLNYHPKNYFPEKSSRYETRGEILHKIADVKSIADFKNSLTKINPHSYRPFSLLLISHMQNICVTWTPSNNQLEYNENIQLPYSSSSFQTKNVISSRKKLFLALADEKEINSDFFFNYHKSHIPEKGPFSVCMHREDAKTVSFSHIIVKQNEIIFKYLNESPCKGKYFQQISLNKGV